jgi:uncharacterized BrkB/YihY/UPF0761 family membrane protein
MTKIWAIIFCFLSFYSAQTLACPSCSGSGLNPREKDVWIILTVFIAACYIPMYYLFKTIYKYRNSTKPTA